MARPRRPRPDARGFTLPEVLVALAIFALASIVLASSYLNILSAYTRAEKGSAEDPYVAMARQQLLTQPNGTLAMAGGEFDTPQPLGIPTAGTPPSEHVKWTADIEPTTEADLFSVTLTCIVTPSNSTTSTTDVETFMLLRPTWSQGEGALVTNRGTLRQQAESAIAQLQGKTSS